MLIDKEQAHLLLGGRHLYTVECVAGGLGRLGCVAVESISLTDIVENKRHGEQGGVIEFALQFDESAPAGILRFREIFQDFERNERVFVNRIAMIEVANHQAIY